MVTTIRKYTGGAHPFLEFACLSTDTKPVDLVPDNSICHEIDTGKKYYFANNAWHEAPARGGSGEGGGSGGGGSYTLPTASASTKGGVKIGSGLSMDGEVLSATGGGAGKFVVTLTSTEDQLTGDIVYTADESVADIVAAKEDGKECVLICDIDGVVPAELKCVASFSPGSNNTVVEFSGTYSMEEGTSSIVTCIAFSENGGTDAWSVVVNDVRDNDYAVNLTESSGTYTSDKSYGDVLNALETGKHVYLVVNTSDVRGAFSVISAFYSSIEDDGAVYFVFGDGLSHVDFTSATMDDPITYSV